MPVDQDLTLAISCDNPGCPGNDLAPTDRMGWTFVNAEVYGLPPGQFVYCCADCAGTIGPKIEELAAQGLSPSHAE